MLTESIEKHFLAIFLGSNLILTGLVWEIHIVNPGEEKGKAAVGRICRKGRI